MLLLPNSLNRYNRSRQVLSSYHVGIVYQMCHQGWSQAAAGLVIVLF